jgi:prepilin-type processing-associated H-X9-DG protein
MWDHWFLAVDPAYPGLAAYNHVPGGCNVLYLDGHVEWVRQGTKYPIPETKGGLEGPPDVFAACYMGYYMGILGGAYDIP